MSTNIRSLVKIVTIDDIIPAENADRLELAVIGGWHVVVPKDRYRPGERVVFAEIDSAIPVDDPRFAISEGMKSQARLIDGIRRLVIYTANFRGNLSQGIIFPLENFPEVATTADGVDISEPLGITKWEKEITISGNVIGDFDDTFARRSDAERIQNLTKHFDEIKVEPWYATEKLDGTSVTIVNDANRIRIFGRNREYDPTSDPTFSIFPEAELLQEVPTGWAIQGEMVGEKIQGNKLKLTNKRIYLFNVFASGRTVERDRWSEWMLAHSVPLLPLKVGDSPEALVAAVNGLRSVINPKVLAEGVVFHHQHGKVLPYLGRPAFKVINNKYLLKSR